MLAVVYSAVGQITRGSLPVLTDQHAFVVTHISSVTHVVLAGQGGGAILISSVAHITGSLHIAGMIQGAALHVQGLGTPGASHGGVVTVQGIAGGNAVPASQSGTWTIQPGNTPNTIAWLVNVQHISTVLHVSIHGFGFHNTNVVEPSTEAIRVTNVTHVTVMGTISHLSGQLHITAFHSSGALRAWQVSTCGTTASLAIATNRARRDLILQNIGTRPIFIGYGTTGHVALTTSNGFMLHAGEGTGGSAAQMPSALGRLELRDYNGPIACIATDAGQTMNVLEILKN